MTDHNPGAIRFEAHAPTIELSRESRTIRGKITSYGSPTSDYRRIVMHEGALRPRLPLSRVKLLIDHDQRQPVGFMSELDTAAELAAFKLPEGEAGDKALADAEAKLRDGLSVGIQVLNEDGAFTYDAENRTYHVHAAELVEVSLVAIPAYQDAGVTSVAASAAQHDPSIEQENTPMPDALTQEQLDASLAAERETFGRELDSRLAAFSVAPEAPVAQFATFGTFLHALVAGDEGAKQLHQRLAYEGSTTDADKQANPWVADTIKLVNRNRRITNLFRRDTLPEKGMTLEYLKLKSNTIAVAKQAKQGDNLVRGKIELESATAPINTYGGVTEVSRQIIDRANPAYLTTAFRAMDLEYARATEADVRALVKTAIGTRTAAAGAPTLAFGASAYDWLDLIVDASELYDESPYTLDGALVSTDVFKRLIRLEDTNGNSLMRVWGTGTNQVGELDVRNVKGELATVKFETLPGADANTLAFYNQEAATTWEDAGAPHQLQDENVLNLTGTFSKYGYMAAAVQHPDAIVGVKITGAPAPAQG